MWQNNALDLSSTNKYYTSLIMIIPIILSILIVYIIALLRIAFYTLLERKILGYFQTRKGPNKVGIAGLPQPLADALKLFLKEQSKPKIANISPFLISPFIRLLLALLLWSLYPISTTSYFLSYSVLLFLCISRLNVYTTLAAGWVSNRKYALLGSLRRVAQTISYEVSIALILLSLLIISSSFDLNLSISYNLSWPVLLFIPLSLIWFTTTLAETNRTPFDFAEGESELVSGFNTEYSRGSFALIFIAEYANIIIISLLSSIFIFGNIDILITNDFILMTKTIIIASIFIWIRASLPRIRYDRLINLTWKSFLPFALCILLIIFPFTLIIASI